MEDIHRMGNDNDEDNDGFTKVSKKAKRSSVRFPASVEVPVARIDAVPECNNSEVVMLFLLLAHLELH